MTLAREIKDPAETAVRQLVAQQLESLARSGVMHLGKARPKSERKRVTAPAPTTVQPTASVQQPATSASKSTAAAQPALPLDEPISRKVSLTARVEALNIIRNEVAACTRCQELACTRKQTVFGVGNPEARICFVGEAPGADEDAQGEPFVGRAGQLLTKIIEACQLKRPEVYILNVLKCRPPGNRPPQPDEIAHCRGYLERQLEIIRPEAICCLGTHAAQTVLNSDTSIGRLRGRFHDYRGIPVLCTYHPSYLLRNPAAKKDVWEDMKIFMRRLGVELDAKGNG
jgi:DNA polymerase